MLYYWHGRKCFITGMAEHALFCRKAAHVILYQKLITKDNFRLLRWGKEVAPKTDSKWICYVQAFPSQSSHLSLILTGISKTLDYVNSVAISLKIIIIIMKNQCFSFLKIRFETFFTRIGVITFMQWWFAEASGGTPRSSFQVSEDFVWAKRLHGITLIYFSQLYRYRMRYLSLRGGK